MNLSDRLLSLITLIMGMLIFILPSAIVALPKGGVVVAFMLLISLLGLGLNRCKFALSRWERYFVFSFVGYFAIIALNLWWFDGNLKDLDTPSRLILVLPIFFFLRKSDVSVNWVVWGVVMAVLFIFSNQVSLKFNHSALYTFQDNSGILTLYASILGIASLFFISKSKSLVLNTVFALSALSGITASLLLGGRGVWVAAFLSIIVLLLLNPMAWRKRINFAILLTFIATILVAYVVPNTGVKGRIGMAISNVSSWMANDQSNTSSGARLEMWKASYKIVKQNLIIGVGEDNYAAHQRVLIEQGKIDPFVGKFHHPHGEYITSLVEQGLLGLFALLMVFLIPVRYALRLAKESQYYYESKPLILTAIVIALHYIFYSVTSGVFDHQSTALFYAVFMVITLGLIKSISRKVT